MKRDPKLSEVTAIIDTREQTPFDLAPMKIQRELDRLAALVASIQGLDQIGS